MTPFKTFAIIAGPCVMTGLAVGLAASTEHLVAGLSIVALVAMAVAYLTSWSIEWARQDAVRMATVTLVAELNERNNETAALRRRLESMKRRAQ